MALGSGLLLMALFSFEDRGVVKSGHALDGGESVRAMPSGYEKSDDYGGPEPGWNGMRSIVVFVGLLALILLVGLQWQ
ncbi:hypothetical protein EV667_4218 [Ancylobacter aquaticus]|uniref:Uncharacterized protein n=1 Tax=Ancylobacter aquaticus TaxID=100 RepID=A0A4R1HHH0_ANCAQ|nr:hypothetical protein EV667_4218 [Ancylobacter aquaticus]